MVTKLKIRRIEQGLKQKDLAEKAGITTQYLYNLENGKQMNPSIPVMKKLAVALDDTVENLFITGSKKEGE